jgi:hypothetical protein
MVQYVSSAALCRLFPARADRDAFADVRSLSLTEVSV